MKTTVNTIRYIMLLACLAIGMTAWSQRPHVEKMSITTQMLLDQMEDTAVLRQSPARPSRLPGVDYDALDRRPLVAMPEMIDGQAYMSAFVRIATDDVIDQLTDLGVIIQCQFGGGLLTALIPMEKIDEVAALEGVKRINAAECMRPLTDKSREATNVDDVLTLSSDALAAGLDHEYDGTGVIVGIIDTGIDYRHIAFQGTNGTRIKRIYNYTYTQTDNYGRPTDATETEWTGSGTMPTTDDNTGDHGTHTSSIAGGSSVIVNGSNVTVTDDHSAATYGGMAPGADLYLAGIKGLNSTYVANAFKKMSDYADAQNQPLVVNNSWGSHWGPHDGTDEMGDVVSRYFGDNHPNKICLFATSNDAGKSKDGEGGGHHVSGTATSGQPLGSILRSAIYYNYDGGVYYNGIIASAWARNTSVTKMGMRVLVLDANTGAVKTSETVTKAGSVSLSDYYNGSLYVYYDYIASDKTQIMISANNLQSKSTYTITQNGSTYYKSNYTLAIQFYPISGGNSTLIDVWGGDNTYFTNHLTTNGYNWTAGSDDMTASSQSTMPDVISVGAYVSKNQITNYQGTSYNYSGTYTLGDIASFSGYATADKSPTGLPYPWITAPGARVVAGVNHYHTASVNSSSFYADGKKADLVVNSSTSPYGVMQGTSMATPTAVGIVALWLQAAREMGKSMTTSDIKEVMRLTAIHDQWTDGGANASHFGNGKINALAGIEYILGGASPRIIANPAEVTFGECAPGGHYTATVVVRGRKLTGDITASLTGGNGAFAIDQSNLGSGGNLVITFTPDTEGNYTATITLTSPGADPVTVIITGTAMMRVTSVSAPAVVVPAYHSDVDPHDPYIFSQADVEEDIDMNLSYPYGGDVSIRVENDAPIQSYELHHKVGDNGNWTYPNGTAVAIASHDVVGNSYVVDNVATTFPADASQMWLDMADGQLPQDVTGVTYYVPVTMASSIVEGSARVNSYGAPIRAKDCDQVNLEVRVQGYKSDTNQGGHWTQTLDDGTKVEYCVYAPVVTIHTSDLTGVTHKPYMLRAWLVASNHVTYYDYARVDGAIEGSTELQLPKLLGTVVMDETTQGGTLFTIGRNWNPSHDWNIKLENTFGAPCDNADVNIVVRAYYQRAAGSVALRANRDGGSYAYSEGTGTGNGIQTAVMELNGAREVASVTYVNALGQQSSRPFDGVNIVVTRYTDGTTSTVKVVR